VTCGVFGCHVCVTAMSRSVIPRLQSLFIPNCLAAVCNGFQMSNCVADSNLAQSIAMANAGGAQRHQNISNFAACTLSSPSPGFSIWPDPLCRLTSSLGERQRAPGMSRGRKHGVSCCGKPRTRSTCHCDHSTGATSSRVRLMLCTPPCQARDFAPGNHCLRSCC
jgi:hypothetical protein